MYRVSQAKSLLDKYIAGLSFFISLSSFVPPYAAPLCNPYSEITLRVGLDTYHMYIISCNVRFFNRFLKKFGIVYNFFFLAVQTNRRLRKIFNIQNRRIFLY